MPEEFRRLERTVHSSCQVRLGRLRSVESSLVESRIGRFGLDLLRSSKETSEMIRKTNDGAPHKYIIRTACGCTYRVEFNECQTRCAKNIL